MHNDIFIWPTFSEKKKILCFDSDDSYVIFSEWEITDEHIQIDKYYSRTNSPFMMSVIAISNKDDHIILDKNFEINYDEIKWYIEIYKKMWLFVSENIHFVEIRKFLPYALDLAEKEWIKIISCQWYSHIQNKYTDINNILDTSVKLNKKTQFSAIAKKYRFQTPKNETLKVKDIPSRYLDYKFPKNPLYIKWDWVWWGNNIQIAYSENDVDDLININPEKNVLIQEKIKWNYLEIISEYKIWKDEIECTWHIWTIIYWSLWNWWIYSPKLKLPNKLQTLLNNSADWLKQEWYYGIESLFCWFDVFINKEDFKIVEINARWLWTWTAQILLKMLWIYMVEEAICIFDNININDISKYHEFVVNNLYSKTQKKQFSIIPLWISAYTQNNTNVMIFFLIIWDFDTFFSQLKKNFDYSSFEYMEKTKIAYKQWHRKLKICLW